MKQYLKLIRPFHWVKNLLIFVPLFFSGQLFNLNKLFLLVLGFIAFSFVASSVYIVNDIQDADKDRKHPKKRFRPIASGRISKQHAVIFLIFLLIISVGIMIYLARESHNTWGTFGFPIFYLVMNVAYSNGLKNFPLVDVVIIAVGFVIRLLYGGVLVNITISDSLLLTVISASMFLGFGKRRNELRKGTSTRKVLKVYSIGFLDKIMYVFIGLTLVFYSLWSIAGNWLLVYTVPLAMVIVEDYCLIIESGSSDGDPAEVLKHSESLLVLLILFILMLLFCLYAK